MAEYPVAAFYAHIFSPIFGLILNVLSQLLICRYATRLGLLKSIFIGFFLGLAAVIAIEVFYLLNTGHFWAEFCAQLSLSAISYAALGYCYFHFINLGETARRVRIVIELYESDDGLSMDQIIRRYCALDIINFRLQRMVHNEQIVDREDTYHIGKPTMLWMARILVLMKLILLGKKSEFG